MSHLPRVDFSLFSFGLSTDNLCLVQIIVANLFEMKLPGKPVLWFPLLSLALDLASGINFFFQEHQPLRTFRRLDLAWSVIRLIDHVHVSEEDQKK